MGQNTADPAADAHDADLAEEADLAKDAKIEALKKMAERQHRHDTMEERINQIFPTLGSSTKYPTERFDFIMDIGNQLDRLNKKKQSRSDARFMILKAIARQTCTPSSNSSSQGPTSRGGVTSAGPRPSATGSTAWSRTAYWTPRWRAAPPRS